MNPYYNLPLKQRLIQSLVDTFNADELLWRSLSSSRKRRKKTLRKLPKKLHHLLDVLEFERKRLLDDCVGRLYYEQRSKV
jgi:hypothetical protein